MRQSPSVCPKLSNNFVWLSHSDSLPTGDAPEFASPLDSLDPLCRTGHCPVQPKFQVPSSPSLGTLQGSLTHCLQPAEALEQLHLTASFSHASDCGDSSRSATGPFAHLTQSPTDQLDEPRLDDSRPCCIPSKFSLQLTRLPTRSATPTWFHKRCSALRGGNKFKCPTPE